MRRGGENHSQETKLQDLIHELHKVDSRIDDNTLKEIVAFGSQAVPYLENILRQALQKSSNINVKTPQGDKDWFVVIHALYLLAELRSEDSLGLVLEFLSQKQDVLDYWLHELLDEDVWETLFFLGQNRLDELQTFVLDQSNNVFSRLAVCTALVQIGLHDSSKMSQITEIFKQVLTLKDEDSDFSGLLVSELLDLKDEALKPALLEAIEQNDVWEGIITVEEVNSIYENKRTRKLEPLNIFERYWLFRQYTNFTATSPTELSKKVKKQNFQKQF
ncbi:DUF1186 domain-containing protein [candidate division KSB1 bacterium]|nr:DUF1186 domain-containing protein [candidate division KSB1 bacterium]NIR71739.1 DUF1186 domain-containing protein [candidate division KSB1 bacterium]NIS26420.1 DUF1186 domain-containing protein [candidate division KSB1 bacterium]NIT73179.1 DUF1186 domain-containing protein [candidate division KSB1 bacterium]NIU27106.1 DUF1186 domain-containing protein [candidate division KSB1 bacterium]